MFCAFPQFCETRRIYRPLLRPFCNWYLGRHRQSQMGRLHGFISDVARAARLQQQERTANGELTMTTMLDLIPLNIAKQFSADRFSLSAARRSRRTTCADFSAQGLCQNTDGISAKPAPISRLQSGAANPRLRQLISTG